MESPLYSEVWGRDGLSKRERSIATVATLITLRATDELPAHLRRAVDNGADTRAFSELITHLAFYAGFPAAISASICATQTLGPIAHD